VQEHLPAGLVDQNGSTSDHSTVSILSI